MALLFVKITAAELDTLTVAAQRESQVNGEYVQFVSDLYATRDPELTYASAKIDLPETYTKAESVKDRRAINASAHSVQLHVNFFRVKTINGVNVLPLTIEKYDAEKHAPKTRSASNGTSTDAAAYTAARVQLKRECVRYDPTFNFKNWTESLGVTTATNDQLTAHRDALRAAKNAALAAQVAAPAPAQDAPAPAAAQDAPAAAPAQDAPAPAAAAAAPRTGRAKK